VTDPHEHDPAVPDPGAVEGAAAEDTTTVAEDPRPDPRLRPPDPAGTQPKWDPDGLLPKTAPQQAAGRLWAPPAEGATDTHEDADGGAREPVVASVAATAGDQPEGGDDAPAHSRYSGRFQFLLGALLAVGAAAIVLLVAVLAGGGSSSNTITLRTGPPWSSWKPAATGSADAATAIAEHVGREYRLPNGQQLVAVTGGPMQIAGLPVTIAIQQPAAKGGDIDFVEGAGVLYRMCGLGGKDCGIAYGKPSPNRHMLLRREALELALYSFRYLGVTQTVVLLPPGTTQTKSATGKIVTKKADPQALLFRRDEPDVSSAIAHPLTATLVGKTPSVGTVTRSPDATAVRSLTNTKLFNFRFQESNQDARAFLVLNPLSIR
jgi:hypothetical protein